MLTELLDLSVLWLHVDRASFFSCVVLWFSVFFVSMFLAVPWVGLQSVIVASPDHSRLRFSFPYASTLRNILAPLLRKNI